ncbi:hypothetical protein [Companilactobacillus nodensis]|uniref:hypothetical protein n=1 Tax=Companilactobacillus nodensis TaxID=460870 RepID=UPI00046A915A|nr:hypothetical protein [Companilactobacillus nodensis]
MRDILQLVALDTSNKSDKQINKFISNLPPVIDVVASGKFLIFKCSSMLNESGAWARFSENRAEKLKKSNFESVSK